MQALILAAGLGRRLGEFTSHNTKCMVQVNGVRLIDRMLEQLEKLNLTRIVMVIGYEGEALREYIMERFAHLPVTFVENPVYYKTNNIYSLWLARRYMAEDDTLLLESDLIFEDAALQAAYDSPYSNVALVAKYETWMDGTMVTIDEDNNIVTFIPKKAFNYADTDTYYKTVNIYKFTRDFIVSQYLPFLEAYIKVLGENEYYEQVLRVITLIDACDIKAHPITGVKWYEIDDVQDLRIAETIFAEPALRLEKIQHSYGGYWRYPHLLDFCYLVNPYFPKERMVNEMKANFSTLLREYPSGMNVNSLLASKYFNIRHEYVAVGNGAAELIKSLIEVTSGSVGMIYPTFEEYSNRLGDRVVPFVPQNADFSYTAEELMDYFDDRKINMLLIVNPDNPTGNFIDLPGLQRLCRWSRDRGIRLVIDESFVDFSEGGHDNTLLRNELLGEYPDLVVVRSISKSYGVPGLRLGVVASADSGLTDALRRDVSIWNINSFAEFYMQIYGKYEKDYELACRQFRRERDRMHRDLETLPWLRVIPSQANYFLCELTGSMLAPQLTLELLSKHNILIKDCSGKRGFPPTQRYVRIAVRDRADNEALLRALHQITPSLSNHPTV